VSNVAVIGAGYVGLTTAAYLAHLGHSVVCADVVPEKVEGLNRGVIPIVEDGLAELVREGLDGGRLAFVVGAARAVQEAEAEFVFLCVPTPQAPDGSADLSYIESVAREIGPVLEAETVVINKSTVPVGSTIVVERALARSDVFVVSNPEFLREGSAVHDCLHPDRIVIGSEDQAAAIRVTALFGEIKAPVIVTDPASAETIKYASNALLATKVSFVNAVANLCEAVGADVREVVLGMGYDRRIGFEFLKPGPGWGGSCLAGWETVLVRRGAEVRLCSFEDLFAEVDRLGADRWEVLAWRPGEARPEFCKVSRFTARPFEGDLCVVRTKMGRRVACTPDHPFVVGDGLDEMAVDVKTAAELSSDDWLPVAQQDPLVIETPVATASVLDGLPLAGIDEREVVQEAGTYGTVDDATHVPASIPLGEDFWRVLGLYLAEGHVSADGRRRRLCWSFHRTEEAELVEDVAAFWRRLGVRADVRSLATTCNVSISSRILAAWFCESLKTGSDCYTKRIPDLIWSQPDGNKRALLRGLWDGDGSWSLVAGGPSAVLEYGTVSRVLADGMLRLLAGLGVTARLKVGRTPKSNVDCYWLTISRADQIESCLWLLPEAERVEVRDAMAGQAKRIAPTGYRALSKNASWVRVSSVERRRHDGRVYSLEVPGAHTIVTTFGLVVHNCLPKDTRAMVRIGEEFGYDFSLLKGVIAVNEEQFERTAGKIERLAGGSLEGRTVAVWGLTFKARTDDVRQALALEVISRLRARGATVRAYDPAVAGPIDGIDVCADPYAPCEGASVLAVLTEWDEFRWVDFDKAASLMAQPRLVDARNLLDPAAVRRRGFVYEGMGRP
jgi:UDPglucose 6-dehydrogenase